MTKLNIENIDLSKLSSEIEKYENQWIAISDENKIVGSGNTYSDALKNTDNKKRAVFFKVPSLKASLAP